MAKMVYLKKIDGELAAEMRRVELPKRGARINLDVDEFGQRYATGNIKDAESAVEALAFGIEEAADQLGFSTKDVLSAVRKAVRRDMLMERCSLFAEGGILGKIGGVL